MEEERILCVDCKTFYGTPSTKSRCSSCWKKYQIENPQLTPEEEEAKKIEESKPKQENKERCWNCNRKCGLNGIECKCGYIFCSKHRLPESHECIFDHRGQAKKINAQKLQNGQTVISKLEKMDSTTDKNDK